MTWKEHISRGVKFKAGNFSGFVTPTLPFTSFASKTKSRITKANTFSEIDNEDEEVPDSIESLTIKPTQRDEFSPISSR